MRAPLSWLREYAALPDDLDGRTLAGALIRAGLEVETVEPIGAEVTGPLVIGKVLAYEVEVHSNGKSIRWCRWMLAIRMTVQVRAVWCAVPQLRGRRLRGRCTARRGAARALRDFRAQDLRPCLRRHDLLGEGAGSRR